MSDDDTIEITVLTEYCKGCGLCVEFCAQGKLYIDPTPDRRGVQTAAVRADVDCTGCLQCATICPDAAIEVRRIRIPVRTVHDESGEPHDT
jgi:2-oxoglutarate ferredoxin oxidoreductase subunit delta